MLQAPSARTKLANRVEMCAIASVSHIIAAESVQLIQKQGPARWRKPAPVPSGWSAIRKLERDRMGSPVRA